MYRFHPNPEWPTVTCASGKWDLGTVEVGSGGAAAACLTRNCSSFWSQWSDCSSACGGPGATESRTFVISTNVDKAEAVASECACPNASSAGVVSCVQLAEQQSSLPQSLPLYLTEHRECLSLPHCTEYVRLASILLTCSKVVFVRRCKNRGVAAVTAPGT